MISSVYHRFLADLGSKKGLYSDYSRNHGVETLFEKLKRLEK